MLHAAMEYFRVLPSTSMRGARIYVRKYCADSDSNRIILNLITLISGGGSFLVKKKKRTA